MMNTEKRKATNKKEKQLENKKVEKRGKREQNQKRKREASVLDMRVEQIREKTETPVISESREYRRDKVSDRVNKIESRENKKMTEMSGTAEKRRKLIKERGWAELEKSNKGGKILLKGGAEKLETKSTESENKKPKNDIYNLQSDLTIVKSETSGIARHSHSERKENYLKRKMTRKNVQKVKGREGDLVGDSKKRVKKPGPETEKNIYKVGEKVNQDGGQEEKKEKNKLNKILRV